MSHSIKSQHFKKLHLERLESRDVPAVITPGWVSPPATNDLFAVGTLISGSTPTLGVDGPQNLFAGTAPVTFADGQSTAPTDVIEFSIVHPVLLHSYQLFLGQESDTSSSRTAHHIRLYASSDNQNFLLISEANNLATLAIAPNGSTGYAYATGDPLLTVSDTFIIPIHAQYFRLEVDRLSGNGPRVFELDAFGTVVAENSIEFPIPIEPPIETPENPATPVISGRLWADNGDGLQDYFEGGVEGVVILTDLYSGMMYSAATDEYGYYEFLEVDPGFYQAEFLPSTGNHLGFSPQHVGNDGSIDSDVNAIGQIPLLIIEPGFVYSFLDAGIIVFPVAEDDLYNVNPGSTLVIDSVDGVLVNDAVPLLSWTSSVVTGPSFGSLS